MPEETSTNAQQSSATAATPLTAEDLLKALATFQTELQAEFSKQINGLAAKTRKELEGIKSSGADSQQPAPAQSDGIKTTVQDPDKQIPDEQTPGKDRFEELQQQLVLEKRARERQHKELVGKLEAEKLNTQRLRATQDFTRFTMDRVISPEDLIQIAESRGLIKQVDGVFQVFSGKDEFTNDEIFCSIEEGLDTLLKAVPYLEKPRPGNGTGAVTSSGVSPTDGAAKYNSPQKIMDAVMAEEPGSLGVLSEIQRGQS